MKKFYRMFRTSVRALRRNVMRAVLTTLGIVIGVGAVIAMMEIGHGTSKLIQSTIASMGANNLMIFPGTAASGGVSYGAGSVMSMTPQDAEAIEQNCPDVRAVAPVVRARTQIVYGNRNWVPQQITGTTPSFLVVRDWTDMAEGEAFTDRDVRNGSKVCLLGQTIVRQLFQNESAIGKEIRLQNVSFRVIGVLSTKGASTFGTDQDDIVVAPWTTIKYRVSGQSLQNVNQSAAAAGSSDSQSVNSLNQLYPTAKVQLYPVPSAVQAADRPLPVRFANVDQIVVSTQTAEGIPGAMKEMTDLLRERHRIRPGEPDDFTIRDMTEMMRAMTSTTGLMTTLLLCVAAISLVVGGVGIMNIMLVSVTERTHEIGLRMAVGARGRDILWQFLTEAVLLCLAGGAIGILLGRGASILVRMILRWPTEISPVAIVVSVLVSAFVGIAFGFYPAYKAAALDPIEALRYE